MIVVDDQLLLDVLAGTTSTEADSILGRANLLTADATATALVLEASAVVGVSSSLMDEAASIARVDLRLLLGGDG